MIAIAIILPENNPAPGANGGGSGITGITGTLAYWGFFGAIMPIGPLTYVALFGVIGFPDSPRQGAALLTFGLAAMGGAFAWFAIWLLGQAGRPRVQQNPWSGPVFDRPEVYWAMAALLLVTLGCTTAIWALWRGGGPVRAAQTTAAPLPG